MCAWFDHLEHLVLILLSFACPCLLFLTDWHQFFLCISFSACIVGIYFLKRQRERILKTANECEIRRKITSSGRGWGKKLILSSTPPFTPFSAQPLPDPMLASPQFLLTPGALVCLLACSISPLGKWK